jgi:hypothetical protein
MPFSDIATFRRHASSHYAAAADFRLLITLADNDYFHFRPLSTLMPMIFFSRCQRKRVFLSLMPP